MGDLIFIDLETTGLDPARHAVWEIAWAREDGSVTSFMPHLDFAGHDRADKDALRIGRFDERYWPHLGTLDTERELRESIRGATIVGANPAFDTAFLAARWSERPWHHRLIDIETYAMPIFGLDRPIGLAALAEMVTVRLGEPIAKPDHTAAQDVRTTRAIWHALRRYSPLHVPVGLGKAKRQECRVYECGACGRWHLTSKPRTTVRQVREP